MIQYRCFRNADPPQLVRLWHEAELGHGAAGGFSCDAFDALVLSQPYFDPRGLIVALDEDRVIGFAHGGFGTTPQEDRLDRSSGVVCAVIVHPDYRRQGIGRELVARVERYLQQSGAQEIFAGPAYPRDPFYFGLYGGAEPCGFLKSDAAAEPFFTALGYEPVQQFAWMERNIAETSEPINLRVLAIRRTHQLELLNQPPEPSWWWITRIGRLDSLQFLLCPRKGGEWAAMLTVIGLDLYIAKWGVRAIGISGLQVREDLRRKRYGQAMLTEVARRLRQELATHLEASVPMDNAACLATFRAAGFQQIDTGVVYQKRSA